MPSRDTTPKYPSGPNGKWTDHDTANRLADLSEANAAMKAALEKLKEDRSALREALDSLCDQMARTMRGQGYAQDMIDARLSRARAALARTEGSK